MNWTAALQATRLRLATARQRNLRIWRRTRQETWVLVKSVRQFTPRQTMASVAALVVLGGGGWTVVSHILHSSSWLQVYRSGHYLGVVPNKNSVSTSMQRIADGYDVKFQTVPIHTQVQPTYHWAQIESFPTPAAVITLDDKPLLYTTSFHAAKQVLHDVKQALTVDASKATHITSQFVGHVGVSMTTTAVANILQPEDATRAVLHPQKIGQMSGRASSPAATLVHASVVKVSVQKAVQPLISVQSKATMTKTVSLPYHVKYESDANLGKGDEKVLTPGKSGVVKQSVLVTYVNGQPKTQRVLDSTVLTQSTEEIIAQGTNAGIASGSWIWPTTGYTITSPFGWRSFGGGQFHPGVDIGVPMGTPIFATNDGVVLSAGWNSGGYGNWVEIDNGNGITTVFGHMSRVAVQTGVLVHKGEVIGYSGESGEATGPHLHYEVRVNGTAVDPMKYT